MLKTVKMCEFEICSEWDVLVASYLCIVCVEMGARERSDH